MGELIRFSSFYVIFDKQIELKAHTHTHHTIHNKDITWKENYLRKVLELSVTPNVSKQMSTYPNSKTLQINY